MVRGKHWYHEMPDIKVGRYVVRNDTTAWSANANNFYTSLTASNLFKLPPFATTNFLDSQYYWAEPCYFTTDKQQFINSVYIAENDVHGNWHLFSTTSNYCNLVSLSEIPPDGYGLGRGGSFVCWILHSCKVIPMPYDYELAQSEPHLAFDMWFKIFNGLHAVVGYRTETWIADSVMPQFVNYLCIGASVVGSWLSIVYDDIAD